MARKDASITIENAREDTWDLGHWKTVDGKVTMVPQGTDGAFHLYLGSQADKGASITDKATGQVRQAAQPIVTVPLDVWEAAKATPLVQGLIEDGNIRRHTSL